jgi:quercetin dioxygenase-like cupin family protein
MSQTQKSQPAAPGKMVIFTAAAAPTLDETGMMSAPSFPEGTRMEAPFPPEFARRQIEAAHLTVPFRQEGPGGFSLVTVEFAPGYLLPRHSHDSDCLYYVIGGSLIMGMRELGPGDGFFLPRDQPYAYRAGPQGVKLLEFRHQAAFDMKIWERDMDGYRQKAAAALGNGGAASSPAGSNG